MPSPAIFAFSFGQITQAIGTPIIRTCPPRKNRYTRVSVFGYTCGGTAHILGFLTVLDTCVANAIAAAGQKLIVVTVAPTVKVPVAGDYCTFQFADKTTQTSVVTGWNAGTKTVTVTDNLTTQVAAGASVWFHGQASDHTATEQYNALVNGYRLYTADVSVGLVTSKNFNEPIVFLSANNVAAGILEQLGGLFPAK